MFTTFDAQTDVIELRVRVDDIKIDSNTFPCMCIFKYMYICTHELIDVYLHISGTTFERIRLCKLLCMEPQQMYG
jgi:ABC-type arginine transport system ATPase subunit